MSVFANYKGLLYLVLLFIVLPWMAWSLALKSTATKRALYRRENKEVAELRTIAVSSGVNTSAEVSNTNEEMIASGRFIKAISKATDANRVVVEKYAPYKTTSSGNIDVMTAEVVMSGGYTSLVKVIEYIEQEVNGCRIISTNFRSTKDRRTGRIKLTLTLLIQQINTAG